MVKQVFMSIITAGIISLSFSSCSKDDVLADESVNNNMEQEYNGPALESLDLNFQDFNNPGDVYILDADTTQISVSKAFADKLGIKSFAGHPMGIRQSMEEDSYMCKATKQKLVGDRYIIDVAPCSLAELLNGADVRLSSDLFVNQDVKQSYFKSSVDIGFAGEIGAKLKIWKWELGELSKDITFGKPYNLFHYNFPHEEGDEANGSFDNILRLLNPYKNW